MMKKSRKPLLTLLSLILLFAAVPLEAYAAVSESIAIYYNNRNVSSANYRISLSRGQRILLDYRITPSGSVTGIIWRSSNTRVAEVDSYGYVYANEPGETIVTVETDDGNSASCVISVSGSDDLFGAVVSNAGTDDTVKLSGQVPREVALNAARLGSNGDPVKISGYASISVETMQAVAGIGAFLIHFDTKLGEKVIGRLTFAPGGVENPADAIRLGVYSQTGNTDKVQRIFDTYYSNAKAVILCDQSVFPLLVAVSAGVGSLDSGNLHFYSYDATWNTVASLSVAGAWKDAGNYLHFTTQVGGYIIASDGPLTKQI